MFYSILFYSILFYSLLFYSILFYFILFYSILFYSILFYSIYYKVIYLNLLERRINMMVKMAAVLAIRANEVHRSWVHIQKEFISDLNSFL